MILIIGGAYQGKLDYALYNFNLTTDDVFTCTESNPTLSPDKKIIYNFHLFVLAQIRFRKDEFIDEILPQLSGKIIISDDISCGIVPTDAQMRAWREMHGRCLVKLSQQANEVIRVFCGLGARIK